MKPVLLAALAGLAAMTLVVAPAPAAETPGGAPPVPPLPASPVATFRQLLALPPTDRDAALAARPEAQRQTLRTRLAEYDSLSPERREERLQATDLYWHLQQLIRRAPAERVALLAAAPDDLRPILVERLAVWDRLPDSDRRVLVEHEQSIRYFARWHEIPQPPPLPGPSLAPAPAVSLRLQGELSRLQELTPDQRQRAVENWHQFFDSPGPRAERALRTMSASERMEMQEVLRKFRALPPGQRQTCIDSFARLANLPPADRAEFLRRAERWEALPASERAAWRRLVTLLPPLPPVPEIESRPTPPIPTPPPRKTLLTNSRPQL